MKLVQFFPRWLDEQLKGVLFGFPSEWVSSDPRKQELMARRTSLQREINYLKIRVDPGAERERAALREERDVLTLRIRTFGF